VEASMQRKANLLVSELAVCDSEGQECWPLDNLPSLCAPADQRLMEKDDEEDDPEAVLVLTGWINGLSKTGIMANGGLVGRTYAATVKRIRLKLAEQKD
jgi:hypothetical protein